MVARREETRNTYGILVRKILEKKKVIWKIEKEINLEETGRENGRWMTWRPFNFGTDHSGARPLPEKFILQLIGSRHLLACIWSRSMLYTYLLVILYYVQTKESTGSIPGSTVAR